MTDPLALHRELLHPDAWPDCGDAEVQSVETHVSRLYFVDDRVYKVKKPVDFGFLNFTTLERRRHFCREEVRLNDRFAPDTYLGVLELRCQGDRIRAGQTGKIVDYAVAMRRLPAALMLDQLIRENAPGLANRMATLATRLARLHADSKICREKGADLRRVQTNWQENFRQCRPLVGITLEERALVLVHRHVAAFLEANARLLLAREAAGHVRDGHGDLHAEQICLTDPIRIYDCIEFNRRFRIADTLADLAFLLMDLDFRRRRDLSATILDGYQVAAGPDPEAATLLPFYKLYRAWVRGKVDSFLAVDGEAQQELRDAAALRARGYFNLALGYLVRPQLLLTCGLMGTGKSTLAAALAAATGAKLLRSDVIRKDLAGKQARGSAKAAYGAGIYRPEFTAATYDRLGRLAAAELAKGKPVIVDAAFGRSEQREDFFAIAHAAGRPVRLVWTTCRESLVRQRLAERQAKGDDPSDGRPALLARQQADFEPPAAPDPVIRVDTAGGVDYTLHFLLCDLVEGRL